MVFLHGLTFDRRSWRPIVERLAGSVQSIAIDLPAHGDSGGMPAPVDDIAKQVHGLVDGLGLERPIVVGHSMAGGLACLYASEHATRGVVVLDNAPDIRPVAQLVRQLEPALRGSGFAHAWQAFGSSLGLERIPEPERSLVTADRVVYQDVVLGYWDRLLRTDPAKLQAQIDTTLARIMNRSSACSDGP